MVQGLAIRKRGGGSHAHALDGVLDRATVPDVLWTAFFGQGGKQRIRRFIALAQYDTPQQGSSCARLQPRDTDSAGRRPGKDH